MNRWRLYRVPVIGRMIPSPVIETGGGVTLYGVRHPRFALWITDPYGRRAGDPAASWGPRARAWRFGSIEQADRWIKQYGSLGTVAPVGPVKRR